MEQKSFDAVTIFKKIINGVLEIKTEDGSGSGFLIDYDGYALTNAHVVTTSDGLPNKNIVAKIAGEEVAVKIVKLGDIDDLALIKLSRMPLQATPLVLGDFNSVETGEEIFVIGNSEGKGNCITKGIVSDRIRDGMMWSDVSTNPGNSGGPVLNKSGLVVGVHSCAYRLGTVVGTNGSELTICADGMKRAIPIDTVKQFLIDKCNYKTFIQFENENTTMIETDLKMKFCHNCGQPITNGMKFCGNCGAEMVHNLVAKADERKTTFDGNLHKCPNCGELLRAFESVCPACKYELRGVSGSSAIREFTEKLAKATSENQKIVIVTNFPVPNTKEDICEFMLLAYSNFDATYYEAHLNEEDISDAWLAKIKQCYQKAKWAFGNHPDFERIANLYTKVINKVKEEESKIEGERAALLANKEAEEREQKAKALAVEREQKAKLLAVEREQKSKQRAIEIEERSKEFKKTKLRSAIIAFAIFSLIFAVVAFASSKIFSGIIAVVMLGLFIVAFLMGCGIIKGRFKKLCLIPFIIGLVLIIPYSLLFAEGGTRAGLNSNSDIEWKNIKLSAYAPQPILTSAEVMTNSTEEFYIYSIKCSENDFYDYVNSCKDFGYDYEIITEDENSFEAYNESGYFIDVSYYSDLRVELTAPMIMSDIEWPDSEIAKLVPQPEVLYGKIVDNQDERFSVYIGNITLSQYKNYVNLVYNSGFSSDYIKGDKTFYADKSVGVFSKYHISVEYKGFNTIYISIYKK